MALNAPLIQSISKKNCVNLLTIYQKREQGIIVLQSTREEALKKIGKYLSYHYVPQVAEQYLVSWIDALKKSIKKDNMEGLLACKICGLLWVTLGQQPEYYEPMSDLLSQAIQTGSSELKAQAIASLCLITCLEEMDDTTLWEILDSLRVHFEDPETSTIVSLSALHGYGLLYGLTSTPPLAEDLNEILDCHMLLLDAAEVEVRTLAGENIALILESFEETKIFERLDELIAELNALSVESKKSRSKKDRVVQKASFREILTSVQDRESPLIKLKFKHETVEFDTWGKDF